MLRKLNPTRSGCCLRISSMIDLVGCFGIGLIEHHALVAGAFDHRGERHDPDRRKTHHPDIAVLGAGRGRQRIKLGVAYMDKKIRIMSPLSCDLYRDSLGTVMDTVTLFPVVKSWSRLPERMRPGKFKRDARLRFPEWLSLFSRSGAGTLRT